jgi:hypothetical protein
MRFIFSVLSVLSIGLAVWAADEGANTSASSATVARQPAQAKGESQTKLSRSAKSGDKYVEDVNREMIMDKYNARDSYGSRHR